MKSVALHNLGCKVNAYEMDVMQQMLQENGYKIVPFDATADIYIINTCTVTNIADRKSRQMLHRAKKQNPDAVVVAVGCYVQTGRETIEKDDCIDLAIGNNKKKELLPILEEQEDYSNDGLYTRLLKYVEEKGLKTVNDEGALRTTIEQIIKDNPQSVEDYHNGKKKAMGFLVGQTMKAMKGKANPAMVNAILHELLV